MDSTCAEEGFDAAGQEAAAGDGDGAPGGTGEEGSSAPRIISMSPVDTVTRAV
jgi:hypothetical protein